LAACPPAALGDVTLTGADPVLPSSFRVGAAAAGVECPKALPCQALDHASGYLMAFAAMVALSRRMTEGGSWHVRVALARTAHWFQELGRIETGLDCADIALEDIADLVEEHDSGFGRLTAVRHAAQLSETPAYWARPSMPLGSHHPVWPRIEA